MQLKLYFWVALAAAGETPAAGARPLPPVRSGPFGLLRSRPRPTRDRSERDPELLREVLGGDLVEELAELRDFLLLVVGLEEHARLVEDLLVGEDRNVAAEANGERDCIRRSRRDPGLGTTPVELDLGVEGALVE